MTTKTTIAVRILDHEYQVRCEETEMNGLIASAHELDERMRDVRAGGKVFGLDRIAVIAALNIAHENLHLRTSLGAVNDGVGRLTGQIDEALADLKAEG